MLNTGVNGKILKVIVNMYKDAKSCVIIDNLEFSEYFKTYNGVRQGENLSPVLFALFLNDLQDYLSRGMSGLTTIASEARDVDMDEIDIERFLNLFLLLYADDTVIFSESVTGLQDGLNLIK